MLPTAMSMSSVHELSKAQGNGRTVPIDALKVGWLGAADISAIQAHPIVRQELTCATEKCRDTCQVRLWYPMSGAAFLENVTRTLRKAATDSVPKSELIFGIVNDSHSERGVHWTLRLIHVDAPGLGAATKTSASTSTRGVQVGQ